MNFSSPFGWSTVRKTLALVTVALVVALTGGLSSTNRVAATAEAIANTTADQLRKAVGAGNMHRCVINSSNGVECWGTNANGELGQGNTNSYSGRQAVNGLTSGVKQIAAGNQHTCAVLASDGSVECWGRNFRGVIGNGDAISPDNDANDNILTPTNVITTSNTNLTGVTDISSFDYFTCAVRSTGAVLCWGYLNGGFGISGNTTAIQPKAIQIMASGAVSVAVGENSACAIMTDATVKCWGTGGSGQMGHASATAFNNVPTTVTGLTNVVALSVGLGAACALRGNGEVHCWGNNLFGVVGDGRCGSSTNASTPVGPINSYLGVTAQERVIALSLSYSNGIALTDTGRSIRWGGNSSTPCSSATTWITGTTVVSISASGTGLSESCYVKLDRTVVCNGSPMTGLTPAGSSAPGTPGTPTAVVADQQATITVVAPSSGGPVDSYTVTAVPGPLSCTVTPPATNCTITGLTNGTAYTFTSKANNPFGSSADSAGVTKTPTSPPGTPGRPTVVVDDREATVTVVPPLPSSGGDVASYTVTATPGGRTCTVTPPETSCTVTGLTNGTAYEFSTVATNDAGDSSPSPKSAPLVPNPVPDVPASPSVTVADGEAVVTITPNGSGGTPNFYTVTAEPGGATCTVTPPAVSCNFTGLMNGTPYEFTVSATNDAGTSPQSDKSSPRVPDEVPRTPAAPSVVVDDQKAIVTVLPPADGGAPLSYVVTAEPGGATCTVVVPATSCTMTGLTNGTAYEFSAIAINDAGTSTASPKSSPLVPNPIPDTPAAPTVTVSDGEATVKVAPNGSGAPVDVYTVTAMPGGKTCTVTPPATSCTISGLTNGTPHEFTVAASNDAGTSPSSKPSPKLTPDAKPGTPKAPTAVVGDGTATVTVGPGDTGGKPLTYTVTAQPGGATCTVVVPATSCTITGLTNGTAYSFSATATNDSGTSAPSALSATRTPNLVPPAPPAFTVKAGRGQAIVEITASPTGGITTSFVVTAKPGGLTCTIVLPETSCTVTGLKNGARYTFTVVAANDAGVSTASAPSKPIVPGVSAAEADATSTASLSALSIPVTGSDNETWPWAALLVGFGFLVLFSRRRWSAC